jgi:two-component system chemotaxis sensor kinase CheA
MTYRISFKPPKDIFLRGLDPVNMVRELIELGWGKVVAQVADIPFLEELDTDSCYTYWDVILTTNKGINAIKDVFIFIEEDSEIRIDVIHTEGDPEHGAEKKLGEILIERGHVDHDTLQKVLGEKKLIGEILIDAGIVPRGQVEAALAEQRQLKEIQDKKKTEESATSIRVASDKLDKLVNLVGELVTVQSRLSQTAAIENNITFSSIAEEVERLTTDLRDTTMNIRMLPIGSTFTKFRRLVRDLSQELGKEIEIETEGAETELDKTVIEKLNDPMVHLIRNSIDHGIELPRDRVAAGKSPKGTIHLSALHSGAFVLIRIKDDGGGLNTTAIRAKAIEKGLITQGQELSDKEIYALILAPGFSTAQKVTNVSGRGVGMDVVKQAIDALRGTIEIDSELGIGTTITLRLPLTLAIIDGFLIKVATEYFVLPLASVAECMELTCNQALHAHGRNIVNVRESIVPFIRLRDIFRIAGERPAIEHLVITETENGRIGIVADNIIGEHQTVIKNLGTMYRGINCLSGATILGDGTVALILDVQQISGEEIRKEQIVTRN